MRRAALLLLLAGCGGLTVPQPKVCAASFRGNFADASQGRCPTLDQTFAFEAAAPSVSALLKGSIDLGPGLVPGSFSSQSAPGDWNAVLTREPGCVVSAGRDVVPSGSFLLVLDSLAPAHGRLELLSYVHALGGADCGLGDAEHVTLDF